MKVQTLSKGLDLLVEKLSTAVATEGNLSPLRAGEIVSAANITAEDLAPYADFDHPVADCYGRKLVVDNGSFEVMVMSWNPRHYSSIHNHGYTQWGVVQVFGNTHHMIFHEKDNELRFSRKEILTPGGVVKVNNKFIHQMGNATSDRYMTLHVYGCNDRDKDVTADAKNYDLEFNRVSRTTGGAFFNLPKEEIYDFQTGPRPTNEVLLHYSNLVLNYYDRQPSSVAIQELQQNILDRIGKQIFENNKQSGVTVVNDTFSPS
ncbi:MAG: putative metal-dependent enzyme (double-stranded beta helix superfamily) [Polaribacter sp.]|jgi:predicted metal-dependent enzyme (double-stranded beta helix superfamily)